VLDRASSFEPSHDVTQIPTLVLLTPDGIISRRWQGL